MSAAPTHLPPKLMSDTQISLVGGDDAGQLAESVAGRRAACDAGCPASAPAARLHSIFTKPFEFRPYLNYNSITFSYLQNFWNSFATQASNFLSA